MISSKTIVLSLLLLPFRTLFISCFFFQSLFSPLANEAMTAMRLKTATLLLRVSAIEEYGKDDECIVISCCEELIYEELWSRIDFLWLCDCIMWQQNVTLPLQKSCFWDFFLEFWQCYKFCIISLSHSERESTPKSDFQMSL